METPPSNHCVFFIGANPTILDCDSLSMLEHAMKDGFTPEKNHGGELYVWGSNSNNSLGPQVRTVPELMDAFHKKYPDEKVQKVCIEKFHSVIVSSGGKVYCCGHGQGGRLGLGTQQTLMFPEMVHFPENKNQEAFFCRDIAISKDHTLFLGVDGLVSNFFYVYIIQAVLKLQLYSCGLNVHKVLGLSPPPQQALTPTLVRQFSDDIQGVCASQYHSVAFGAHSLYTWGFNGGQLGHKLRSDDKYVIKPKPVVLVNTSDVSIIAVGCSEGATCVYTSKGDIYVLHEHLCRYINLLLNNPI